MLDKISGFNENNEQQEKEIVIANILAKLKNLPFDDLTKIKQFIDDYINNPKMKSESETIQKMTLEMEKMFNNSNESAMGLELLNVIANNYLRKNESEEAKKLYKKGIDKVEELMLLTYDSANKGHLKSIKERFEKILESLK